MVVTTNLSQQRSNGVQKNPYATTSRKRSSVDTVRDTQHVDSNYRHQDLASIVLGRPTQPLSGNTTLTTRKNNETISRKNHRRRVYRDRWEFGCSLEIGASTDNTCNNYSSSTVQQGATRFTDCLDGDTAGGAASEPLANSCDQELFSTPSPAFDLVYQHEYDTENINVPEEDDDLLSFVAFPASQGRLAP